MSEKTLGEMFIASRGAPVLHYGKEVHAIFEAPIQSPTFIIVRFIRAASDPPQGLRLKVTGGWLHISQERFTNVTLWTRDAPPSVEVRVTPKKKALCVLKAWNEWEDGNGVANAWIGNAGMLIEHSGDKTLLRCSDGFDNCLKEPDFEKLVVEFTTKIQD